ncbi:MFS transporter [Actinosynnema sp. CS-041913]|uniref:MFS transporter n=1 Tax=Actinosynnema sp. CS-041913 TaxID=3239917 RepID=UPI003D8CB86F
MHTAEGAAPPRSARHATAYVVTHYLLMYLGYYGLISTLVVTLKAASFTDARVAVLVMVFALTNKISNIPLAPLLDRIPAAYSVLIGCLVASGGFVGLRFASGMVATVVALGVAGIGISVNALASKQLAAAASDRIENQSQLFSLISIGVNVAAAVAAPLALLFVDRGQHGWVLLAVALLYGVAGVATFLNRRIVPVAASASKRAFSVRTYTALARTPGVREFLLVNMFYWFLYGQLFNVLAVYVSQDLHEADRLGWLYTANAALVVVAQLAVTRMAGAWSRGSQLNTVVASYSVFAVGFAVAWAMPGYWGAVAFVVVFTTAEMLYVPAGDVVIVRLIPQGDRAVGYSVFAVSTAIGEALGAGAGVWTYRWFAEDGVFWLLAAVLAVVFTIVTHLLRRSSAGLRAAAAG